MIYSKNNFKKKKKKLTQIKIYKKKNILSFI